MRREYEAERKRGQRALVREVRAHLDIWRHSYASSRDVESTTEWLMGAHVDDPFATLPMVFETVPYGHPLPFVPLDYLKGETSNAGPDEGVTTRLRGLSVTLDRLAERAAQHEWFTDEPHWCYGLHDLEKASRYLDEVGAAA